MARAPRRLLDRKLEFPTLVTAQYAIRPNIRLWSQLVVSMFGSQRLSPGKSIEIFLAMMFLRCFKLISAVQIVRARVATDHSISVRWCALEYLERCQTWRFVKVSRLVLFRASWLEPLGWILLVSARWAERIPAVQCHSWEALWSSSNR